MWWMRRRAKHKLSQPDASDALPFSAVQCAVIFHDLDRLHFLASIDGSRQRSHVVTGLSLRSTHVNSMPYGPVTSTYEQHSPLYNFQGLHEAVNWLHGVGFYFSQGALWKIAFPLITNNRLAAISPPCLKPRSTWTKRQLRRIELMPHFASGLKDF